MPEAKAMWTVKHEDVDERTAHQRLESPVSILFALQFSALVTQLSAFGEE
jgi:hypothetical protein